MPAGLNHFGSFASLVREDGLALKFQADECFEMAPLDVLVLACGELAVVDTVKPLKNRLW